MTSDRPLAGLHVGVFGLGEAGREVAGGLAAAGASVRGFDPADVATPEGVTRCDEPSAVVVDAELIIAVTASADAATALDQAFEELPDGAVYADLSTSAPARKRELAERCGGRVRFVDVALMTTAPGRGLDIPSLACGPGAPRYVEMLAPATAVIELVPGPPGTAATRKLLRSIAIKGLAGVVIESMRAAEAAGLADETWANLAEQFTVMDEAFLQRLVDGTPLHAERRFHEMEAARDLLHELGVEPTMTDGTVNHLDRLRRKNGD